MRKFKRIMAIGMSLCMILSLLPSINFVTTTKAAGGDVLDIPISVIDYRRDNIFFEGYRLAGANFIDGVNELIEEHGGTDFLESTSGNKDDNNAAVTNLVEHELDPVTDLPVYREEVIEYAAEHYVYDTLNHSEGTIQGHTEAPFLYSLYQQLLYKIPDGVTDYNITWSEWDIQYANEAPYDHVNFDMDSETWAALPVNGKTNDGSYGYSYYISADHPGLNTYYWGVYTDHANNLPYHSQRTNCIIGDEETVFAFQESNVTGVWVNNVYYDNPSTMFNNQGDCAEIAVNLLDEYNVISFMYSDGSHKTFALRIEDHDIDEEELGEEEPSTAGEDEGGNEPGWRLSGSDIMTTGSVGELSKEIYPIVGDVQYTMSGWVYSGDSVTYKVYAYYKEDEDDYVALDDDMIVASGTLIYESSGTRNIFDFDVPEDSNAITMVFTSGTNSGEGFGNNCAIKASDVGYVHLGSYAEAKRKDENGEFDDVSTDNVTGETEFAGISTCYDYAYYMLNHMYNTENDLGKVEDDYYTILRLLPNNSGSYEFNGANSHVWYDYQEKMILNDPDLPADEAGGFFPVSARHLDQDPVTDGEWQEILHSSVYDNYHYMMEGKGTFIYKEDEDLFFDFTGDDDVYLFINGKLAMDIGACHAAVSDSVHLNDVKDELELEEDGLYEFLFLYMDRMTVETNIHITTNIQLEETRDSGWRPISEESSKIVTLEDEDIWGNVYWNKDISKNQAYDIEGWDDTYMGITGNPGCYNNNADTKISISVPKASEAALKNLEGNEADEDYTEAEIIGGSDDNDQIQVDTRDLITAKYQLTYYVLKVESGGVTNYVEICVAVEPGDVKIDGFQINTDTEKGAVSEFGPSFRIVSEVARVLPITSGMENTTSSTTTLRYEFEDGDIVGADEDEATIEVSPNFSPQVGYFNDETGNYGGAAVGGLNEWPENGRKYVTNTVNVDVGGVYMLTIGYAEGADIGGETGGYHPDDNCNIDIRVNGSDWASLDTEVTDSWEDIATVSTPIVLKTGENVVDVTGASYVWNNDMAGDDEVNEWVNLDYFDVQMSNPEISRVVSYGTIYTVNDDVDSSDMKYEDIASLAPGQSHEVSKGVYVYPATEDVGVTSKWPDTNLGSDLQTFALTIKPEAWLLDMLDTDFTIRSYAITSSGKIIYSDNSTDSARKVVTTSIYDIAENLYNGNKMGTQEAHEYLYDNVLNQIAIRDHRSAICNSMLKAIGITTTSDSRYDNVNTIYKDMYYFVYMQQSYASMKYYERGAFTSQDADNEATVLGWLNSATGTSYSTLSDWIENETESVDQHQYSGYYKRVAYTGSGYNNTVAGDGKE